MTLVGQLSYGQQTLSNICGWVDTADGKEYALVGAEDGLSIVDITTPSAPVEIIQIPGPSSTWREIKVNGDYAYVTTESGAIGLQIVELTNLPATNLSVTTWQPVIGTDTLKTIHALHIDNGKVYLYGSNVGNKGAIIADIVTNPMVPAYLGSWDTKYIHDGYVRNDTLYAGHIYDGECEIVDLTNPAAGVSLATFFTPSKFTHNTWLTADSKICMTTDEVNYSYLGAFDVSNLANIFETDRIQSNPGSGSIVHNTHVIQANSTDYAVTSWYNDGFTIVDISRPGNLVQVGNYDTDKGASGPGFNHCWGVYPFFPSGTIVASDIQNGLYVFSPNYVRACYLEGLVLNCGDSSAVPGVDVQITLINPQADDHYDVTDVNGAYAIGVAVPDTYQVILSKVGFLSDTDTVIMTSGALLLDTFYLCMKPTFSFNGNIFDNSSTTGVPGAHVSVYDAFVRWDTISDANGNFTLPAIYSGTFTIASGQWGYVTKCTTMVLNSSSSPVNLGLDKGIYDDFFWDYNWTVSGSATKGIWERGEPKGTQDNNGNPVNPDKDVTNDCSVECYVTGNQGSTQGDDDVDGGATVLTSPTFDLSTYTEPYVFYSRWKRLSFNSTDTLKTYISNGTTKAQLENITLLTSGQAQWVNKNFKISSFVTPSATMQFSMEVSDYGQDNTIEGGLDKFYILDSTNSSVSELGNDVTVVVWPNPADEIATLLVSGSSSADLKVEILDLTGRKIQLIESASGNHAEFRIDRGGLAPGLYIYRLLDGNSSLGSGKITFK